MPRPRRNLDLLSRLLGPPGESLAIATPNAWPVSQTPGILFGRAASAAGVAVTEETALSLSGVFAAVNQLSRIESTLPLGVFRRAIKNDRVTRTPAWTHPADYILGREFNEEMTAAVGRGVMAFCRPLWGNSYAEIEWAGNGKPAAIWPIQPWRVRIDRQDKKLYYMVDGTRRVEPADMIHVPHVTLDGVVGRGFVEFALTSLGLGIAAQEHAAAFFANGAWPGGMLKHAGQPTEKARGEMRRSWAEQHQGPQRAGGVAVVWGGWEFVPGAGSITPEQAQLLESRRFTTEEVARWLNVPPHVIRDLSRATNNNIEQQGIDFIVYSIGPTLVGVEQEYDRKLLDAPTLHCSHDLGALMKGDSAQRAAFYNTMTSIGAFCVNDVLEREGMNPIGPEGDEHFVPMNMVPIKQAVKPPEPKPAAPPPPPFGGDGQPKPGESPPTPGPKPPAAPGKTPPTTPGGPAPKAMRAMLEHTLSRMMRVEAKALRRAAEKPGRLFDWMDGFYPKHAANLAEALAFVLAAFGDMRPALGPAMAGRWCESSRGDILNASESPPAEFAARVELLLSDWERRPAAAALEILPCTE